MSVFLVRHAETDGNKAFYVGREDLPLNAHGREQARELAARLQGAGIGRILSSPMRRAIETAEPLAVQLGLVIERRAGLIELDFGQLQGQAKQSFSMNLKKEYRVAPLPGGESMRDVWMRLEPVVAEIRALAAAGARPLVVGHYWSNRLLHERLRGVTFEDALRSGDYKPGNGSVIEIAIRNDIA